MNSHRFMLRRFLRGVLRRLRDLTPAAKYLVACTVLGMMGTISLAIPIYQMFCALMLLLAVAEIAAVIFVPCVTIVGRLPEKTTVGEPISGWFNVKNTSLRPVFDLTLGFYDLPRQLEQQNFEHTVPYLRGGGEVRMPVTLMPKCRGVYELPPLVARSTFPFNLVRAGRSSATLDPVLVLPAFQPLELLEIPVGSRYQPGGITLTSHIGESPEYIGNREYVVGEPARRFDARSWARWGKPVVREYQEEYYCRIALILDTFVPPDRVAGPEGFDALEAAISLTAAVADALSGGEYIIDLFAAGQKLYVFRSGRHTAHFENLLEILACVEASRDDPIESILPAVEDELANVSTAVCILLDWDAPRRRLTQTVLEAGCQLTTLLVNEGPTREEVDVDHGDLHRLTPGDIRRGGVEIG